MFWIGIIVGIIVAIVVGTVGLTLLCMKVSNMSLKEMGECGCLMIEAGNNRESTIMWHDAAYNEFGSVDLPEK